MSTITFVEGDATAPVGPGVKIIAHVCNNVGAWGRGFVLAVSRKWPQAEQQYLALPKYVLGDVQLVQVEPEIFVANCIAQHGLRKTASGPPIRYRALEKCLEYVGTKAIEVGATVHMPRIGCGLAGGRWERIEPFIVRQLTVRDVSVTVYDYRP